MSLEEVIETKFPVLFLQIYSDYANERVSFVVLFSAQKNDQAE